MGNGDDGRQGKRLVFTGAAVLVICIAVFIFGSFGFSGARIILPENTLYAVAMGRYNSESTAQRQAAVLQQRGAAGYVYQAEKEFLALAVCFKSEADAQSVVKKLTQAGETAEVVVLSAPKAVLETQMKKKTASALRTNLTLAADIMYELCDLSVELDNGRLTSNDIFSVVTSFVNKAESAVAEIAAQSAEDASAAATATDAAEKLLGILLDLKNSAMNSAAVKNCICKIFFNWKSFKEGLNM